MNSSKRGALAAFGLITGFLTLVFLSQFSRYLTLASAGDQLSLGMATIYAVLTYAGGAVTLLAFKPSVGLAKYLSGAGAVVTVVFILSSLYLFVTGDIASGMMVLIITGGQALVTGVLYAAARSRESDSTDSPDGDRTVEPEPEPERELGDTPNSTPAAEETHESGRDIDWRNGAQIFIGVVVFLIGIPITVASPVGVPILVAGLALIPRVRNWGLSTLGRATVD